MITIISREFFKILESLQFEEKRYKGYEAIGKEEIDTL